MEIIGITGSMKFTNKLSGKVSDLNIKNIDKALQIVDLTNDIKEKDIKDLSISELWKIDLLLKLDNDTIIVGNLSSSLNYKSREYIKKVLKKLNKDFNKKIVIIDRDINVFFNIVDRIYVTKGRNIIYTTTDFYDDKLYEYVNMPKIIDFVKYVNKDKKILENHTDIYELIKDIYRSVS